MSRNSEVSEPVSYCSRNSSAVIPDFLSPAAVLNWANDTPAVLNSAAAFTAAFGISQSAAPRDFKRGDGGNGATAADDRGPGATSAIGPCFSKDGCAVWRMPVCGSPLSCLHAYSQIVKILPESHKDNKE